MEVDTKRMRSGWATRDVVVLEVIRVVDKSATLIN